MNIYYCRRNCGYGLILVAANSYDEAYKVYYHRANFYNEDYTDSDYTQRDFSLLEGATYNGTTPKVLVEEGMNV